MKKGIIMQMDDAFLTLLTPEGEFLRAPKKKQQYFIGEEILFQPAEVPVAAPKRQFLKSFLSFKPAIAAAAAIILTASISIPFQNSSKVYAYMSIDVNPSIELAVNKKMQVVKMNAFNQEGREIIEQMQDWKKSDVSDLAEEILAEIGRQRYFKENSELIISTVEVEKKEKEIQEKLEENVKEIKMAAGKEDFPLTVVKSSKKELDEAHKKGITAGKLKAEAKKTEKKAQQPNPSPPVTQQPDSPKAPDVLPEKPKALPASPAKPAPNPADNQRGKGTNTAPGQEKKQEQYKKQDSDGSQGKNRNQSGQPRERSDKGQKRQSAYSDKDSSPNGKGKGSQSHKQQQHKQQQYKKQQHLKQKHKQ